MCWRLRLDPGADRGRRRTLARPGRAERDRAGDLKFAAPPLPVDEAALTALRNRLAGRPIWLAASTHPGEETLVFAVHRQLAAAYPGLLTIVAPRHPERGARLRRKLAR